MIQVMLKFCRYEGEEVVGFEAYGAEVDRHRILFATSTFFQCFLFVFSDHGQTAFREAGVYSFPVLEEATNMKDNM